MHRCHFILRCRNRCMFRWLLCILPFKVDTNNKQKIGSGSYQVHSIMTSMVQVDFPRQRALRSNSRELSRQEVEGALE